MGDGAAGAAVVQDQGRACLLYTSCAGFIRVPESAEPLDRTGVHPESYPAAKKLLTLCACKGEGDLAQLRERAEKLGLSALAEQCGVGLPTLEDMIRELSKPCLLYTSRCV